MNQSVDANDIIEIQRKQLSEAQFTIAILTARLNDAEARLPEAEVALDTPVD